MSRHVSNKYAGRAGEKLEYGLQEFDLSVEGAVCADFGCAVGGFTDCLLAHGARRVYAIDTGYGTLDWRLRNDPRVVVMERTNAMHAVLPESADLIAVDVGWTRQAKILPHAMSCLKPDGVVVSLLKPHYECGEDERAGGVVKPECVAGVVQRVVEDVQALGLNVAQVTESPLRGGKGANREFLFFCRRLRRVDESHPAIVE